MSEKKWQYTLEEYIRQGKPDQIEKSKAWRTAIGLQDVDGLAVSDYLLDIAKEHIEGNISIEEVYKRITCYYGDCLGRNESYSYTKEADFVSVKIVMLLGEKTFQFSPAEWRSIHRRLFKDVFDHAGEIRPYNITKKEWVLNGETVIYAPCDSIRDTMDYDFQTEKSFSYQGLSMSDFVRHIAKFTSDIWQIHPFCEGNTRTTAVFIIKYLRSFGFDISNDSFAEHSRYFRNALVRANYSDVKNGIYATEKYLEMFFSNLLLGTKYELKNRFLHVDYHDDSVQSAKIEDSKCQFGTLECSFEDFSVLRLIADDPKITQVSLAEKTGKSLRTIKRIMASLKEKNYIRRSNGKRNGSWEILIEFDKKNV